jgi:alanine racemase
MDAKQSLGEPRALISREALLHNVKLLRKLVGRRVKICAVVKANAYGHDAPMVIETLCSHGEGAAPVVDCLAVATIDEALELPPTSLPVLIFHPVENTFIGRQRSKVQQAILNGWNLTICDARPPAGQRADHD